MQSVFINGFNVGTDFSATMVNNFGDIFPLEELGNLTEFESESLDKELEVTPISNGGVPIFQTIWGGVRGSIGFARANANLESMVMDLMSAYHDAGVIPQFTLSAAVLNRDGLVDTYTLTGMQLSKPKFGSYTGLKEVDQRIEFRASRMKKSGFGSGFLTGILSAGATLGL